LASGTKVLIVDDDEGMRTSLIRLLGGWGHEVAAAANAEDAIALLETFQPEFAILDVSLGRASGLDLARHFRQSHPAAQLHLIALTAHQDDELQAGCIAAGFDTYLVKPHGITDVQRLLARR